MSFGNDLDASVGRPIRRDLIVCSACQKKFDPKIPLDRLQSAECPYCGVVNTRTANDDGTSDDDTGFRTSWNRTDVQHATDASTRNENPQPPLGDHDEAELQLSPEVPHRSRTTSIVGELAESDEIRELCSDSSDSEQYQLQSPPPIKRTSVQPRTKHARSEYDSQPKLPDSREYPILQSISNNSRRLAWVTATIVLLHLGYELVLTVSSDDPQRTLSQFSRYSFLVVAGCTAAVSLFLGIAETIHVALHIQSNTLEMCKELRRNNSGSELD